MKHKINFILSFLYLFFTCSFVNAAVLPSGFAETRIAEGLDGTSLRLAPDGRVFVIQKHGRVSIVQDDSTTVVDCLNIIDKVDNANERGVHTILFDPDFEDNGHFYLYYTIKYASHNRVSRFTATGDVCDINSEVVIIELDTLVGNMHNGGAMFFKDDKLFITTGDGADRYKAQAFDSLLGKVLRINKDGTIPTDNPFYTQLAGQHRAIYALGLRNPQAASYNPTTGRVFIGDVGEATWEEINELFPKANYGWPSIEGKRTTETPPTNYHDPIYVYEHTGGACAIVGAAWYNPTTAIFPNQYVGKYFFADFCTNIIHVLDPDSFTVVENFMTDAIQAVSFEVSPEGDFYYLSRGYVGNNRAYNGEVYKVEYTGSDIPTFSFQPFDIMTTIGRAASFSVGANGGQPLAYQWYRDGEEIDGATSRIYKLLSPTLADDGAKFKVTVSNGEGNIESNEATLTVTTNTPPEPIITLPVEGQKYDANTILNFAGTAMDNEDGEVFEDFFTWKIDFHHDDHTHPGLDVAQIMYGSFFLPSVHETSSNVWYRIYLTVKDRAGITTTVQRDVYPNKVNVTLATSPPGLAVKLDGVEVVTPYTFEGVVGITRTLEASNVTSNGYKFNTWSNGGPALQNILTPGQDQTFTVIFGDEDSEDEGLSGGAIGGIVAGVVIFVAFSVSGYFLYKKRISTRTITKASAIPQTTTCSP